MIEIITSRIISCVIFDPEKAFFKQSANTRSWCTALSCTLKSCPLLGMKTCVQAILLGIQGCPYGSSSREEGFTKRARKAWKWIDDRRKRYKDIPHFGMPAHKMAFIGDYVYLPYHHMNMEKLISTWAYGCFLPQVDWTLDTVCRILDFRPQAWVGGTIHSYAKEEIPKFLVHLQETDAAMWAALIAERPALDTMPNHIGRKAIIKTLNSPIEWVTNKAYRVRWNWDGQRVRTISVNAYNSTWGGFKLEDIAIEGVPAEDATVVVGDNAWVNDSTIFVD